MQHADSNQDGAFVKRPGDKENDSDFASNRRGADIVISKKKSLRVPPMSNKHYGSNRGLAYSINEQSNEEDNKPVMLNRQHSSHVNLQMRI